MLKGEKVSFRYDKKSPWVVQDASIDIQPGEIVGLRGPSGQGKTTLGKLLAGYLKPDSGQITVNGQPLPKKGYCPVQIIFQHPELAINPRWRINKVIKEGFHHSDELFRELNIDEGWMNRWPNELSGGELQRICVIRALGPDTCYLVADETTSMLDAITQAQIWNTLMKYAKSHDTGILAISHEAALLERISDRIVDFEGISGH